MAQPDPGLPLLDEEHAAFIQGSVSINAASTGQGNVPAVSRALGCRVSPDRRRVTVFLPASRSAALLEAIDASRRVAVTFCLASTHRTIQLKGNDAGLGRVESGDRELAERYARAFAADLRKLGYEEAFTRALIARGDADLTAVAFTPTSAFMQTPGPGAGGPLKRA